MPISPRIFMILKGSRETVDLVTWHQQIRHTKLIRHKEEGHNLEILHPVKNRHRSSSSSPISDLATSLGSLHQDTN